MAANLVARKRNIERSSKVKTGCATCRIRKVKCDENKPVCRKCVDTGRTCDGYDSLFRSFNCQAIKSRPGARLQPNLPTFTCITSRDIKLLGRYFSTKTIFDVELGCEDEARQVLQASLTEPPIRYAVFSLKALREHLETSGHVPLRASLRSASYGYGVQQYCMAMKGLASNLSCLGSKGLKSALLCCQIFISIEQVQGNYAAMAQHIIQGLSIMRQYRARPNFVVGNELVPAYDGQLPSLDVFVIKLFAAPCKFADYPATADASGTTLSVCSNSPYKEPVESRNLRAIAPDMRTELIRIAASTLEFLSKVSHVKSAGSALRLLYEKASLLDSLESWLINLELVQKDTSPLGSELISVSFMRIFHQILKIVLLGTLNSTKNLDAKLQIENNRLWGIASNVGERVKAYRICVRTGSVVGEQFKSR
ncbi:hypothetical protein BKA66DRAFT_574409 [Pyrenochaeta sp. MPI-SDFR-AT-0127]|nr:hypothetical protein BKA66DRAFT_574409 [Pyrenochaeta sp. MPI-SDFR-AT-0127]